MRARPHQHRTGLRQVEPKIAVRVDANEDGLVVRRAPGVEVVRVEAAVPVGCGRRLCCRFNGCKRERNRSGGRNTPVNDAENIKKMFGCGVVTRIPEGNEIEVPSVGDRPSRLMQQRMLGEILEPRARELMELLRDHLRQAGVYELLGAGVVFTGGGSRLNSLLEVGEDILRRVVRLGYPVPIAKLPSNLLEPEFATAIGMVLYGHRARQARMNLDRGLGAKLRALFARQNA